MLPKRSRIIDVALQVIRPTEKELDDTVNEFRRALNYENVVWQNLSAKDRTRINRATESNSSTQRNDLVLYLARHDLAHSPLCVVQANRPVLLAKPAAVVGFKPLSVFIAQHHDLRLDAVPFAAGNSAFRLTTGYLADSFELPELL